MNRLAVCVVALGVLTVLSGCNTFPNRPEMTSAGIAPPQLKPGDTAIIHATIQDRFGIVHRVEGVVKEDPSITFKLKDDGVAPDKEAGDGTWTLQVDVPFNAPPGDFELTLKAYDSDGDPVLIPDQDGEAIALSATFGLVIRFPEQ